MAMLRLHAGRTLRGQPGGDESHQGKHDGTGDQDSRIRRRDPERKCLEPASKQQGTTESGCDAEADDGRGLSADERANLAGARPERDADANLGRTLAHRVREHAVEAERGKRKRDERERPHEHERESLPARAAIDHIGHQRRPVDHQLRIQSRNLVAHGTEQLLQRSLGGNRLHERPVPVAGKLTMGVVDDHAWGAIDVEGHVPDDSEDFKLPAGSDDPLSDHALVGHSGKRHAGKIRAHDRPARRAGIVARVEGAPGQHGNAECGEEIATDDAVLKREAGSVERPAGQRSAANLRIPRVIAASRRKTGDAAGGLRARDHREPARQLLLDKRPAGLVVAARRQVHLEGEDAVGTNAEIHALQALKTREEHTRAREQRQRQRQL